MMNSGKAVPWAVIAAAWEEAGRLGLCETKAKTDQGETTWVLGGESVFSLSLSRVISPTREKKQVLT